MKILIVGGAGYIGSHMVDIMARAGWDIVTLDNLSSGHRDAILHGEFVHGDLADNVLLDDLFENHRFEAVMHFASHIQVGESVKEPAKYYRNNVLNTQNLLDAMIRHEVRCFVFSSTAAIYGDPEYIPIDEKHPQEPVNPYGKSKQMVERMLEDYDKAYGLKSVCLRYFNAAGADPEGRLGERHNPETHLIPLVLQAAAGRRADVTVFGTDYDTPDGTCIRDYIHVYDLCEAHLLALNRLLDKRESSAYNLGNGQGYSVRQVIDTAKSETGRDFKIIEGPRRSGDPAQLVADSSRAVTELGWRPKYPALKDIIQHAWRWELNLAQSRSNPPPNPLP